MTLEEEIVAKGLTAPRVTPVDVENNIAGEYYFTADDAMESEGAMSKYSDASHLLNTVPFNSLKLLTFCVLVTKNGFTVTGESACASPENFDAEIGRKVARGNAIDKLWPLMGYELKTKLAEVKHD